MYTAAVLIPIPCQHFFYKGNDKHIGRGLVRTREKILEVVKRDTRKYGKAGNPPRLLAEAGFLASQKGGGMKNYAV